jgi:cellobiose phosphorylase
MNWQNCHNVIFVGMSHSYEAYYQAVRRCWRFGQNNSVNVHIVYEQREGAVIANIRRKDDAARQMADAMAALMRDESMRLLGKTTRTSTGYQPSVDMFIPDWLKYPQCA